MRSRTNKRFWRMHDALPAEVQDQAKAAYEVWAADPWHNSLQFKRVHPSHPLWSVRIGLHYRAVGKRDGDMVRWFWIGSHADYDRLLRS
jgi:hypothetical protein